MSLEPPTPGLPTTLNTDLSGLTWVGATNPLNGAAIVNAAGVQVGSFQDASHVTHHICPDHATTADGAWLVQTPPLTTGCGGLLCTQADARILQGGTVQSNGSIVYSGSTYWAQIYLDSRAGWILQTKLG